MADGNAFAKEVLELIKSSKFPKGFHIEDVLRQHHAIVTGLNNRVLALVAAKNNVDEISQGIHGGGGGGPPHVDGPYRLDLLLRFSASADKATLKNTGKLLKGILGPFSP